MPDEYEFYYNLAFQHFREKLKELRIEALKKGYPQPYFDALGLFEKRAMPRPRISQFHAFLSDCIASESQKIKEQEGKDRLTLGDTWKAFKKCVIEYNKNKDKIKELYSNGVLVYSEF